MNHNKKRNTAFLFESLVKELTKAALKNEVDRKTQITAIIKEFFYKTGALKTELGLYKEIYETANIPKNIAEKILTEAKKEYQALDSKEIFNEQTKLINKINKMMGKRSFNNFVPNYRVLGSIYQVFNKEMPIKSRVLLENALLNFMSNSPVEKTTSPKLNKSAFKIFTNKFNSTYKGLLEEQQTLLRHYVSSFTDNGLELTNYINEEIHRMRKEIQEYLQTPEIQKDDMMKEKVQKTLNVIEKFKEQHITEAVLRKILKLQSLISEIKQNG